MADPLDAIFQQTHGGTVSANPLDALFAQTHGTQGGGDWTGSRGVIPPTSALNQVADNLAQIPGGIVTGLKGVGQTMLHPINSIGAETQRVYNKIQDVKSAADAGDVQGVLDNSIYAVPVFGGITEDIKRDIDAGNYGTAIGKLMAYRAVPKITEGGAGLIGDAAKAAPGVGNVVRGVAADRYANALGVAKQIGPEDPGAYARENVVPRMMDEDVIPNKAGALDIKNRLGPANEALTEAKINTGTIPQPTAPLIAGVDSLKGKFTTPDTGVISNVPAHTLVESLAQKIRDVTGNDGMASTADIQHLKETWQKLADEGGAYEDNGVHVGAATAAGIHRNAAAVLTDQLNQIPQLGKANADVSYLKGAEKAISEAPTQPLLRPWEQHWVLPSAAITALTGHPEAAALILSEPAIMATIRAIRNPAAQARIALALDNTGSLLGAIRSGASVPIGPRPPAELQGEPNAVPSTLPGMTRPQGEGAIPGSTFAAGDISTGTPARAVNPAENISTAGGGAVPDPVMQEVAQLYEAGRISTKDFRDWLLTRATQHNADILGHTKATMANEPPLTESIGSQMQDRFGHDDAVNMLMQNAPTEPVARNQFMQDLDSVYVNPDGTGVTVPRSIMQQFIKQTNGR